MAQRRIRVHGVWMAAALLVSAVVSGVGAPAASAQITGVKGSAFGYLLNVSLFGGTKNTVGPTPTVTLPAGGSTSPVTSSAPTGSAVVGPATLLTTGQIDVSTQGTSAAGSVTSSARLANLNASGQEVLTASAASSTCTASGAGVTGSATITGGTLQTDSGDTDPTNSIPNHDPVTVPVPSNPAPNTTIMGHIHVGDATDSFRYVFNEQITNSDGSLTVNAAHQYLLGSLAVGDLIIGQVVCGVTGTVGSSTTTTSPGATTTTAPGATTTTSQATTTTAPATTTTAQATTSTTATTLASTTTTAVPSTTTAVSGGAYGYLTSVGLFGGAPATRGPEPTVTLPANGSDAPVTGTLAAGNASYGPAQIVTSGRIDVSTQGTAASGTVTSSATLADVGPGPLNVGTLRSTCTASQTAATGSTTVTGGKLTTSEGANLDSDADNTVIDLPANPAPNTSFDGKVETVGDTFRLVLNEQTRTGGGITVNAAHLYLLGPTAVGDAIIGQSRCGLNVSTTTGGGASGGQGGAASGGGGAGMATTGMYALRIFGLALLLLAGGCAVSGTATRFWGRRRVLPPAQWPKRRFLR
jgi:hypothetical protein